MVVAPRVLAEVYRLHHVPLPAITLQALLKRGPKAPPAAVIARLRAEPSELQKWKELNAPLIITSAQLLHKEVPIRLARRIVDLENLPDELPDATPIVSMREQLLSSFDQMISAPLPRSLEGEQQYMDLHRRIRDEHATMHHTLWDAIKELSYEPEGLTESLDNFYNSRIGIRMLVDQHLAAQTPTEGFTGIVADHASPMAIARELIDEVTPVWKAGLEATGQTLPEFQLSGQDDATYRYVPQHLELILSEVLKNAVFNSVEHSATSPPPINILVAGGANGVCIKVSDFGGGMTRAQANGLLSYHQSYTKSGTSHYDPVAAAIDRRALGMDFLDSFGLRIASLYAQYFGGALSLMPLEGVGVDAYIYMNCLTGASEVKMQSIPFRLIHAGDGMVPDALTRPLPSPSGTIPGALHDTEHHHMWTSIRHSIFPQHIGIQVLGEGLYVVKALRLAVDRVQAPAKVEILAAFDEIDTRDVLTRYLNATFVPCCSSLQWPVLISVPTQSIVQKIARFRQPECSFIKLVIHEPHSHASNLFHQVTLHELELLGSLATEEDSSSDQSLNPKSMNTNDSTRIPVLNTSLSEQEELQAALLEAGVSLDLVMKVVELSSHPKPDNSSARTADNETGDLINLQTAVSEVAELATASPQQEIQSLHDPDLSADSPLDLMMRQYLAQKSHQDEFIQHLIRCGTTNTPETLQIASLMSQVSDLKSEGRELKQLQEIVRYTFGEFFLECLLDESEDVRIACIQTAERFTPLIKDTMGIEIAYEGLSALANLSLQYEQPTVFRAALHLVQTLFQDQPSAEGSKSLGIVSAMGKGRLSSGLRPVLHSILRNACCWSIDTAGISNRKVPKQAAPSIDRSFLSFVRMLMSQKATRAVLFQVMLPLVEDEVDDQSRIQMECQRDERHWIQTTNTFRLIRWLLSCFNDQKPPVAASTIGRIEAFCKQHLGKLSLSLWKSRKEVLKIRTIALQCLHLTASYVQQDAEADDQPEGRHCLVAKRRAHRPLFDELSFTLDECTRYEAQLKSYFSKRPRPLALYHHVFTQESLQDHQETFSKGNIAFRGQVEQRTPPTRSFYQQIELNTQPFEFRTSVVSAIPSTEANALTKQVELKSSFALFNGTLEERKPMLPTSRISSTRKPELQIKAPSIGRQRSRSSRIASARVGDTQEQAPRAVATVAPDVKDHIRPTLSQVATAVAITQAPARLSSAATSSNSPTQVSSPAHPKTAPPTGNRATDKSGDANGCTLQ